MSLSRAKWTRKFCIFFFEIYFFPCDLNWTGFGRHTTNPPKFAPTPEDVPNIFWGIVLGVKPWLTDALGRGSVHSKGKEGGRGETQAAATMGWRSVHSIIGGWQQRGRGFDKYHGKCEKVSKLWLYFWGKSKLDVFFFWKKIVKRRSLRPSPHPRGSQLFLLRWRGAQFRKKRREKKAGEEVLALLLHYTDCCCWHPRFLQNGRGKKTWFFFSSLGGGGPPNVFNRKKTRKKEKNIFPSSCSIYLSFLTSCVENVARLPPFNSPSPSPTSHHARLDTSGKNKLERKKFLRKLENLWAGGIPKK